jgi:hypothetical protein
LIKAGGLRQKNWDWLDSADEIAKQGHVSSGFEDVSSPIPAASLPNYDSVLNVHFINETLANCFIMERLSECFLDWVWIGDYGGSENDEETLFDSGAVEGAGYS